jgi:four helix bundle protein
MKSYKDLEIYQLSYELAKEIHRMTLRLPKYELYEEGAQIRRSSKSIAACIVEGCGRRKYKAEFVKFLIYAHASCDETLLHLNFINEAHMLDLETFTYLQTAYDSLGAKINRFVQYVESEWK